MLDDLDYYEWNIRQISIGEILHRIEAKELILRPEYQRRSVWPNTSKSSFIESLVLNVPIPLFLVHENQNGNWEVVDGQQRLSSIYTFMKDTFKFTKLEKLYNYKDYLFSELPPQLRRKIESHSLLFCIVKNVSEEQIIDMYYRSNKFTVNLNPQELRYAYYKSSDFNDLVVAISEGVDEYEGLVGFFLQTGILRDSNVNRMADLEYTSELLALIIYKQLHDKKKILELIYEEHNTIKDEDKRNLTENIYELIEIIKHIFNAEIFKNDHSLKAEKAISLTRFRQKNDFYSLFFVLSQLRDYGEVLHLLLTTHLDNFAAFLKIMDEYISPEADIEIFSDYAIKCVSQANTKKSREYRSKFILEGIEHILGDISININLSHENINFVDNFTKQTNQLFTEFGFEKSIDMQMMSFIDVYQLLAEFYNEG